MNQEIEAVLRGEKRWTVLCADNAEVLPTLPDGAVDVTLTDPPFDDRTHKGARTGAGAADGVTFAALSDPAGLVASLLRPSLRWVVAFCAFEMLGEYATAADECWVRSGVWDKVNPSPQLTGDRPGQAAEALAIMHRPGRKRWNRGGGAAIWRHSSPRGEDRPEHPTPKPIPLMLELVSDFTDPGELILDPFAGSGTTGVAALRLGRRFIGIERDEKYAAVARERLEAESQGLSLRDARAGQLSLLGGAA